MPVVFAIGWAWITCPDRTFNAFINAISKDNYDLANSVLTSGDGEQQIDYGPREQSAGGSALRAKGIHEGASKD